MVKYTALIVIYVIISANMVSVRNRSMV